jgi:hypothetical protein
MSSDQVQQFLVLLNNEEVKQYLRSVPNVSSVDSLSATLLSSIGAPSTAPPSTPIQGEQESQPTKQLEKQTAKLQRGGNKRNVSLLSGASTPLKPPKRLRSDPVDLAIWKEKQGSIVALARNANPFIVMNVKTSSIEIANQITTLNVRKALHTVIYDALDKHKFRLQDNNDHFVYETLVFETVKRHVEDKVPRTFSQLDTLLQDVKRIVANQKQIYLEQSRICVRPPNTNGEQNGKNIKMHLCTGKLKQARCKHGLGFLSLSNFVDMLQCEAEFTDVQKWCTNWDTFLSSRDAKLQDVRKFGASFSENAIQ